MKISEVIDRVDKEFSDQRNELFDDTFIIRHLSILDQKIKRDIFDTHEGEPFKLAPYTIDTDRETELLIKSPYDDTLYIDFILANCNLELQEMEAYNTRASIYEDKYSEFWKAYNRTHRAIIPIIDYRY